MLSPETSQRILSQITEKTELRDVIDLIQQEVADDQWLAYTLILMSARLSSMEKTWGKDNILKPEANQELRGLLSSIQNLLGYAYDDAPAILRMPLHSAQSIISDPPPKLPPPIFNGPTTTSNLLKRVNQLLKEGHLKAALDLTDTIINDQHPLHKKKILLDFQHQSLERDKFLTDPDSRQRALNGIAHNLLMLVEVQNTAKMRETKPNEPQNADNLKRRVQNLLITNRQKEALAAAALIINEQHPKYSKLLALSKMYNRLEIESIAGVLTNQVARNTAYQITKELLDLIDENPEEGLVDKPTAAANSKNGWFKRWFG